VVTDSFTKFVRTCPMRAATAKAVISFLEENIFLLFGVPEIIISDNGSQFIAKIFKEFLTSYGVTHWLNAIYHPQNNPTERVNQVLANSIRCFVGSDHRDWDRELPKITCAINTSFHEATQYTPFYLNFGRQIRLSGEKIYDEVEWEPQKEVILSDVLRDTFEKVKDNLHKSYLRNQRRYDLRARPIIFKPGSVAWRRNFVQSDALKKFSAKLAPKKVKGVITRKVGSNTYEFKDDLTGKTAILSVDDLFPD
jgi:transposase InsO family protein